MNSPTVDLFPQQQWQEIRQLLENLSVTQQAYLRDYLNQQSTSSKPNTAAKVVVAYGTETGNSKGIAEQLVQIAQQQDKTAELVNLADIKPRHLKQYQQLFLVCSTHGDGDPPEPVEWFHSSLMNSDVSLSQLSYAVLALGDSTYDKFCETGRQFDQKLAELGANRLLACVECDVDFELAATDWSTQVLSWIPNSQEAEIPSSTSTLSQQPQQTVSKQQPAQLEVLENIRLTHADRVTAIHHIELGLDNADGFTFSPGDSLGVYPHNTPVLVHRIMNLIHAIGDESVSLKNQTFPLVEALRERCDLTIASSKFLAFWAEHSQSAELKSLLEQDTKTIRQFLKQHSLTEILSLYKTEVSAQRFVENLRPLQPRLYDLANDVSQTVDEIHLTVEKHHYALNKQSHVGVASGYLSDIEMGETVSVYPHQNPRFHLPSNPLCPLILIAEGTGIAPYRAFLQHIAANPARQHSVWLIFKEQRFTEDFLYQTEWQQWLQQGHLTRLDCYFSVDAEQTLSEFINQRLADLDDWLSTGAHLYLSGHKPSLERFSAEIASEIHDNWLNAKQQKRLHQNLY